MTDLTVAYYADDFTGSTDVLEAFATAGLRTVLFLEPPDEDALSDFEDVDVVGVAGRSRTMTPEEMDGQLPDVFSQLGALDPDLCYYKVCSTFDSSPEIGSIGRAIDIGREVFDTDAVPVVVAAPSLEPRGRYVAFGNLFGTVDGTTYRLDRHPTMRQHPVTPMTEADLTEHLGAQTDATIGCIELTTVDGAFNRSIWTAYDRERRERDVVLFDGINHEHQRTVGSVIWRTCSQRREQPMFAVGSVGLGYALVGHWVKTGVIDHLSALDPPAPVEQILVTAGSVSPVTDAQIDWALHHGFEGIRVRTAALLEPATAADERDRVVAAATNVLEGGESPLVYTGRGPDDPAIERTRQRATRLDIAESELGSRLGSELGKITRGIVDDGNVGRICLAGGDTSGHVAPALDIVALEYIGPVAPGSPLCDVIAEDPRVNGCEIVFKGGQVETTADEPNFFGVVRDGEDRY